MSSPLQSIDQERHPQLIEDELSPALMLVRRMPDWNASHVLLHITRMLLHDSRLLSTIRRKLAGRLIAEAFRRHDSYERSRSVEDVSDPGFSRAAAQLFAIADDPRRALRATLLLPSEDRDSALT